MKVKITRNFINKQNVSRHLSCTICQELFYEPVRLNCGHTFCEECINSWLNSVHSTKEKQCPICRNKVTKTGMSRDLIAFNIINDMEVYCNNKGCPWKGVLNDLNNHLHNCIFDSSRIPDNVKNYIDNLDKKDSNPKIFVHDEDTTDKYLNFNKNASLKARLFNKNSQMIISSLNNNSNGNSNNYSDILGTKEDILNQILNIDQNNNINNIHTKPNVSSIIGSKIFNNNNNNTIIKNEPNNNSNFAHSNSQFNNFNNNNNDMNNNLGINLINNSNTSHASLNRIQAGNIGDFNILRTKNNAINDFSLFNNNDQASTISQHSKTSSVYGDEHHSISNEDLLNNINNFNQGNNRKNNKRKTEKNPLQLLNKKRSTQIN